MNLSRNPGGRIPGVGDTGTRLKRRKLLACLGAAVHSDPLILLSVRHGALIQFIRDPYRWEKTDHGLHALRLARSAILKMLPRSAAASGFRLTLNGDTKAGLVHQMTIAVWSMV